MENLISNEYFDLNRSYQSLSKSEKYQPKKVTAADPGAEIPVQALLDAGGREIPDAFVIPEEDRIRKDISETKTQECEIIPVIDIAALVSGDDLEGEKLARACNEWGVFNIINHGISPSLIDRLVRVSRDYFAMPFEDRLVESNLTWAQDGTRDWVDALIFYPKPPRPDRTPRTKWPQGFRETLAEYAEEAPKVMPIILRVLSERLGLSSTRLEEALGEVYTTLRVNYYPACPQPHLVRGMSPHSDVGSMTFIIQNDVPGLQVCKDGEWVTVQPVPGAILVNLGDMLEILSNGQYNSCEHRVLVNTETPRLSIIHFFLAPPGATIHPMRELINDNCPPLYQEVNFREYFLEYVRRGLNRKTQMDRIKMQA